jgi:diaminopimelate decarboxylase
MSATDRPKPLHGYELAASIFSTRGADLLVGDVAVSKIVAKTGTPAYIYDASVMRSTYRRLATALDGFASIHYSVKANPHPQIIRVFVEEGAGVEIASVGEYRAALAAGADPQNILFAGPGKRMRELEEVLSGGIGEIHLESFEEIERLRTIGKPVRCSLRINPVPTVQAGAMRMGGKPTAFGFDEENLQAVLDAVAKVKNIELVGVHVYGGTQILDEAALLEQWRHAIGLASRIAAQIGKPLETIDLGGGLGIPYHAGDKSLDLDIVAAEVPALIKLMKDDPLLSSAKAIVEPGRFLVGPSGIYVAEVNSVKQSRGTHFVVTDGGMHHHLAASGNLGQVIKRSYPVVAPAKMNEEKSLPVTVAGPLCTPLDILARDILMPELTAGDYVAVLQSGAYGITASPINFLSHDRPSEAIVENGQIHVLTSHA